MDFLLFLSILIALTAASAINEDGQPTSEDKSAVRNCDTRTKFGNLTHDVCSTPAVIYFGKDNGELVRCLYNNPHECEVFHNTSSAIHELLVRGEYIYAALESGDILRCVLNVKGSCETFFRCHQQVHALAAGRGEIFVGVRNEIMRCNQSGSCKKMIGIYSSISSLVQVDEDIYAGLGDGEIRRCSLASRNCSRMFGTERTVTGMTTMRNSIYAVTDSHLWTCSPERNPPRYCLSAMSTNSNRNIAFALVAFKGYLFINYYGTGACKFEGGTCVNYAPQRDAWSMAMAYGTHHMQSPYKDENTNCTQTAGSECSLVHYFDELQRSSLEIQVRDGKLYDAQNSLVDTSNADEGHSGPAAILAMGPEGRILLSNTHGGSVHTSSFFAGNPVSGAGEMSVENGVIKKILACPGHYLPDVELNVQVIQSLRTQGYSDPIESESC